MVRSRTWPAPGEGGAYSSMRKSDALGSPTGREARTTRFACGDMLVSSVLDFVIAGGEAAEPATYQFASPLARPNRHVTRPAIQTRGAGMPGHLFLQAFREPSTPSRRATQKCAPGPRARRGGC